MMDWLRELDQQGRLPFLLLFLAFLVTFVVTRVITRLIRAGRGPFRNNVSSGIHIHHAIPGLILALLGAYLSVATGSTRPWAEIAGVLVGMGSSLVLDEFALLLHLEDVYWAQEGQLSVQLVALTFAGLGFVVLGINPLTSYVGPATGIAAVLGALPLHLAALYACVRKGKYSTAVIGAFVPPIAWVGAVRLARPASAWAKRHYDPVKQARAQERAVAFDGRFGNLGLGIADLVAGKPTPEGGVPDQTPPPLR